MRLSRPRVLLRAALLAGGGGLLLWRAWEARAAARTADPSATVLLSRMALVKALMGALGFAAAAVALLALRRRKRTHTLHLGDLPPRGGDGEEDGQ